MKRLFLTVLFTFLAQLAGAQDNAVLAVQVVHPQLRSIPQYIQSSGTIVPKQKIMINAQVMGVELQKIMVKVGQVVHQGQLLAQYDQQGITLDVDQAKAQLQLAKSAYQQAQQNAQRAKKLLRTQAMSAIEAEKMILGETQAKAQLAVAQAQLAQQQLRLSHTEVRAPADGIISEKFAVLGSMGNIGAPLFTLIAHHELAWKANVTAQQLSHLQLGQQAQIQLPHEQQVQGTVYAISPALQANSNTAYVWVALQPHAGLFAGMNVQGRFVQAPQKRLMIPLSTLSPDDGRYYVWLVDQHHKVQRQLIELGDRYQGQVAVLSGLTADEQVVLRAGAFLNEGDTVKIASPSSQGQ